MDNTEKNDPLCPAESVDRLLDVMQRWWAGESLAGLADRHGISYQRVQAILSGVGCRPEDRPSVTTIGGQKRVNRSAARRAQAARDILITSNRLLSQRQRQVVAWAATGLSFAHIGVRIGVVPSHACQTFQAAMRQACGGDMAPITIPDMGLDEI